MSSESTSPPPSSSAMEFLPQLQNCLICGESVEVVENSEKNRKVCEIFRRASGRYLNFKCDNFGPESEQNNCSSLCENCFPLAESFCKIYNKFQYLEQLFRSKMKESIDKIRIEMEKGLENDHDDDNEAEMEGQRLNLEKRCHSQIEFRKKFVMRGKQKLSEGVTIAQVERQGLDIDSETGQAKVAINFLEGSSETENFILELDPLQIKTEQEILEFDDDEEESRSSGLSYWCEICNMEFSQISEFQLHRKSCVSETVDRDTDNEIETHEKSKKFCCKFCGKSFPQLGNLQIHERVHTGAKPYKCRFCERTFPAAGSRSKHERVHTGVKPYECAICGEHFRYSHQLNNHGNLQHPGEKFRSDRRTESGFKCGLCDKFFATVKLQLAHERSHQSHAPATVTAASGSSLPLEPLEIKPEEDFLEVQDDKKKSSGNHRVSKGADLNDERNRCKICGKTFSQMSNLRTHEVIHTGAKPFKCRFCEKTFTQGGYRNKHEQLHSGATPYKCRFCEMTFAFPENRTKHELVHTGAIPFECAICGQKFRQSKSLNLHGDSKHPGENFWSKSRSESSFKCDFCFKVFATMEHKSNHEQSHSSSSKMDPVATLVTEKKKTVKKSDSKAKEHVCEICGKSYDHKSRLKSHMRTNCGAEPFHCKFCGKAFTMKRNLKQHERLHSKNLESHEKKYHGDHDNARDGPSFQAPNPDDAVEHGEGDVTQEGDIPFVKVENSSSPEWNDEEMEAALDAALSIY